MGVDPQLTMPPGNMGTKPSGETLERNRTIPNTPARVNRSEKAASIVRNNF